MTTPLTSNPYPDFRQFLKTTYTDKRMACYHHEICADGQGVPLLKVEGQPCSWPDIRRRLALDKEGKPRSGAWSYLQQGLVRHDEKHWSSLTPFMTLPEEKRPLSHRFELLTGAKREIAGSLKDYGHTWIRLIEPTGEVYSVGMYAPQIFIDNPTQPLTTTQAELLSPDPYEYLVRTQEKVSYPIDEAKFTKLKRMIEAYQRWGLPYNTLEQNCSDFCWVLTKEALDLTQEEAEDLLDWNLSPLKELPAPIERLLRATWRKLPTRLTRLVSALFHRVLTLALAPVLLILGGWKGIRMDQCVNERLLPRWTRLLTLRVILNHSRAVRLWQRRQPCWTDQAHLWQGM